MTGRSTTSTAGAAMPSLTWRASTATAAWSASDASRPTGTLSLTWYGLRGGGGGIGREESEGGTLGNCGSWGNTEMRQFACFVWRVALLVALLPGVNQPTFRIKLTPSPPLLLFVCLFVAVHGAEADFGGSASGAGYLDAHREHECVPRLARLPPRLPSRRRCH